MRDHGVGIPEADKGWLLRPLRARPKRTRARHQRHRVSGSTSPRRSSRCTAARSGSTRSRVRAARSARSCRPPWRRRARGTASSSSSMPTAISKSYVAHTLRDDGFAATVVADGTELLATIDELQFDAAIVDTQGTSACRQKSSCGASPAGPSLIRVDASAVEENAGLGRTYIVKPFPLRRLARGDRIRDHAASKDESRALGRVQRSLAPGNAMTQIVCARPRRGALPSPSAFTAS